MTVVGMLEVPAETSRYAAVSAATVTIGIVAGEPSGDALAATLIRSVRSLLPQARFVGVAG